MGVNGCRIWHKQERWVERLWSSEWKMTDEDEAERKNAPNHSAWSNGILGNLPTRAGAETRTLKRWWWQLWLSETATPSIGDVINVITDLLAVVQSGIFQSLFRCRFRLISPFSTINVIVTQLFIHQKALRLMIKPSFKFSPDTYSSSQYTSN